MLDTIDSGLHTPLPLQSLMHTPAQKYECTEVCEYLTRGDGRGIERSGAPISAHHEYLLREHPRPVNPA